VTITVTPPPPIANPDTYKVPYGSKLDVPPPGVLINDISFTGNPLTAAGVTATSHGIVTLNPDGSFRYEPAGGFIGIDTFTYTASDGIQTSNVATVMITVEPPPPIAAPDTFRIGQGLTLTVPVPGILTNDSDSLGRPLTAQILSSTTNGLLAAAPDGSFIYTPKPLFFGNDGFQYQVTNGSQVSNVTTVTIIVEELVLINPLPNPVPNPLPNPLPNSDPLLFLNPILNPVLDFQ